MGIKGGLRAMERRKNMDARDVALYGLLIALAFVLSYVESLTFHRAIWKPCATI